MKEIDPEFNLWELEDDAKGIFIDAYHHYLEGNYSYLEHLCADSALGYFRVLLKK
jgi:import inner membrane translocase subunit TIM44